jgi:hypothetical protein
MQNHRRDESPERHFRSDRVVMARGRWYVVTRECIDVGPYTTKEAAESVAEQLGQALDGIDDPAIALARIGDVRRRNAATDTAASG